MCDIQHKIHHFHFDLWQSEILYAFRDRWLIIYILIFFMRSFTVGFRKLTLNHQLCITQKSLWDNGGKHKHVITAKYTRTVLLWCRETGREKLTDGSCATPRNSVAGLAGSQTCPGSWHAVGSAAASAYRNLSTCTKSCSAQTGHQTQHVRHQPRSSESSDDFWKLHSDRVITGNYILAINIVAFLSLSLGLHYFSMLQ